MSQIPDNTQRVAERQVTAPPAHLVGISVRALILAALFTVATYLGIIRLGFVRICWLPYVVPPVPALLFLLVLQGINLGLAALARRHRIPAFLHPLSRGELFLIYMGVCVALSMDRGGYILHYLMFPQYYGTDANQWQELFSHYPSYYIPHGPGVIEGFFEGVPGGRIPWAMWWRPLAWWGSFNMLMMFAVMCLVALFRRQWGQAERLTYPMLFLPLEITGGFTGSSLVTGFFRNPVMWAGFGVAALYNGINIAHAFFPTIPKLQWTLIGKGVTEGPLRHLQPLVFDYNLEVWGLFYLMSGEILLSGWVFYFLMKVVKIVGREYGYRAAEFPFYQEFSSGACIAFLAFMIYATRGHFKRVIQSVVQGPGEYDGNEALSYRGLTLGLLASTGGMIWMLVSAGQRPVLLIFYFATLYMFVLIAARIRAEAGPPIQWAHPYGYDTQLPIHFLGTRTIRGLGSPQPMILYYALFWVGRTVFAHTAGQYFTDSLKLADYGKVRRSSMVWLMLVICLLAMALTFWYHLDVGYKYGQGYIGAKTGRAGQSWAMNWSRGQYTRLSQALAHPQGPDGTRLGFYGAGFALTTILVWARSAIPMFPFHPLGLILATMYGDWCSYWAAFLIAWLAQRITLRYGGLPTYRKVVPAFLGLFFGHVLIGGVLWRIIINYFIDPTISFRYYLNLG